MKLRLDRVLKLELGKMTPEEALKSLKPVPDYKPLNQDVHWTAPYPPYKPGWWQMFEPQHALTNGANGANGAQSSH